MAPFCCYCNHAIIGRVGTKILKFVVLSVIIALHNILTPHISKTHLAIVSLNLRELELNYAQNSSQGEVPPMQGVETLRKFFIFIRQSSPFHQDISLPNAVQSK